MTTVDQQTIRRRGTGLTGYDLSLTYDGYTLFAPMFDDGTVYLIDMQGQPVHPWKLPHLPGNYGYLLDNGHLFYSGKPQVDLERLPPWQRAFKAGCRDGSRLAWTGTLRGPSPLETRPTHSGAATRSTAAAEWPSADLR